jgi:hypothetical protein
VYRCSEIEGNQKLAQRLKLPEEMKHPKDKVKTLAETRGQGGGLVVYPSYGKTHESGQPYVLAAGGIDCIATITPEERVEMLVLVRSLDAMPKREPSNQRKQAKVSDSGGWITRPGDDFAARTAWPDLIEPHGWDHVFTTANGNQHWRRPGKDVGTSATISDSGDGPLYVFTSSTDFEPNTAYSKFSAYVTLNHSGDADVAVKELIAQGYGVPLEEQKQSHVSGVTEREWPTLDPSALYGLAGEVVATIRPHTEADDVALLASFLPAFGAAVNAGPHAIADGADHPARLSVVLVGRTSRGRKGSAWANVRRVMAEADPAFTSERILGGLASGEGLIAAVSDGTTDKDGNLVGAVVDKRLLVYEPEWARVLKVCARESSTLSAVLRDTFDRGDLRVMTRRDPLRATEAHVCLVGHITMEELRRNLAETEGANGFGNRQLFVLVQRSKRLPAGGNLDDALVHRVAMKVRDCLEEARKVGILRRSPEAEQLWTELYNAIDDDVDGMVGALTARAEAQILRLSVAYALTDGSRTIEVSHLRAAHALWRYCEASVVYVFGDAIGDEVADRLLEAIRRAGPGGLTHSEQSNVFGRHLAARRLQLAREALERRGLIMAGERETDGRTAAVSVARAQAKEANDAKEGPSL